jgi:hypothetical protein
MTWGSLLICVALVALLSTFIILLAMKLGIIEWIQLHGDTFLSEMAKCNFCLSFWVGTALFVIIACYYDNALLIFGGVLSCPITRYLI